MSKILEVGSNVWGPDHPKISVIIPAINEVNNLPHVAARIPADVHEIVFVDGHSTDGTPEMAKSLWPDGIHLKQTRKGKGNAMICGMEAATGDIIVLMDADGSTDPAEIPSFVGVLLSGADYAKGSRRIQGGGSADFTKIRSLGNLALNFFVNRVFRTRYSDLCYGYNAFWKHCVPELDLPGTTSLRPQWGDGFEIEALMNIRVAVAGLKIAEVCSFEQKRIFGSSNLNAVRDGLRVLFTVFREYRARAGMRQNAVWMGAVTCRIRTQDTDTAGTSSAKITAVS